MSITNFERTESIREEIATFKAASNDDTVDSKAFAQTFLSRDGAITIDRFIVLVEECLLEEKEETVRQDRLVEVLVHTIYSDDDALLQDILFSTVDVDNKSNYSSIPAKLRSINQNKALQAKLINILVALPELASNRLGVHRCPPKLSVHSYLRRLLSVLKAVLEKVHANLSTLTGLALLNLLIGRLVLKGHSSLVWECFFDGYLTPLLLDDLKWLQIARRMLIPEMNNNSALNSTTTTSSMFIEGLLKMAFFHAPTHQVVASLFKADYLQMVGGVQNGGMLLTRMHFLLTNKFLLIHYHSPVNYSNSNSNHHPDQFLWNIFTYLCACKPNWMAEAVDNLLDTWSNASAFRSRPYYQHCYLARALVIAAQVLLAEDSPSEGVIKSNDQLFQHLQRATMASIELHLKSAQAEFRAVGFAAASIVMNAIARFNRLNIVAPDFGETAKRPISNEESVYLKALAEVSVRSMFEKKVEIMKTSEETENNKIKVVPPQPQQQRPQKTTTIAQPEKPEIELDSDDDEDAENDDDLQPYDLSNDIPVEVDIRFVGKDIEPARQPELNAGAAEIQKFLLPDRSGQPPVYLADLVEGLSQTEKPLWAERCLQSAEKIIRANFDNISSTSPSPLQYGRLHSIAHTLTRLLFHLDNQCAIPKFKELRSQALAALAVGAPKIAAKYLAEQFYAPNLNLRQRMDVLAVLTAATGELSFVKRKPVEEVKKVKNQLKENEAAASRAKFVRRYLANEEEDSDDSGGEEGGKKEDWRLVVAERIRANTRLISPLSLKSLEESSTSTSTNAFVPVVGYFFFPLLHRGDGHRLKEELGLRLAEDDAFLLEHLLYTLGLMVQSAANYPVVMLMAKELLAFMSVYRGTELRNVRRAVIMALEAVLHSTPAFYLLDDDRGLGRVLLQEWQHWLKEIALHDVDGDCRGSAGQALRLLFRLKEAEEEKLLKSGEQQKIIDTPTARDLDTTIRILKQTNLR